jgi:hypothetical protein
MAHKSPLFKVEIPHSVDLGGFKSDSLSLGGMKGEEALVKLAAFAAVEWKWQNCQH